MTAPNNPDRQCRHCGATNGLRMLPFDPLDMDRKWVCADGCPSLEEIINLYLFDNAFTQEANPHHEPGLYLTDPQGHALLVGLNGRAATVVDMGGSVHVAGVHVTDPDVLDSLGRRLVQLAGELRSRRQVTK